jgi:serine/threonine protein kinase
VSSKAEEDKYWCCLWENRLRTGVGAQLTYTMTAIHEFRKQKLLGKGSYGSVYKVVRIKDNKAYAMKVLNSVVSVRNCYVSVVFGCVSNSLM